MVVTGLIPKTVRAGEPFVITVEAFGNMQLDEGPEPQFEEVSGAQSMTLWLLPVTPQLTVQQFQTPQVTTGATLPFALAGTLSEGSGDPYFPRLQYQLGAAAPVAVPVGGGAWSIPLNLPPGEYPIVITAMDDFDARVDFRKTLTVLRWDPPADNPALPKTLRNVPTSASITSLTRLEPQCADADITETSAARLFDPLWLMTRQWQVAVPGRDAGTPVQARWARPAPACHAITSVN